MLTHLSSKRRLRTVLFLLSALTVVVLAGCDLGGATTSPPAHHSVPNIPTTPAPTVVLPPRVTSALGPPPANCPTTPVMQTMRTQKFGGGFIDDTTFLGGAPAWQIGFGRVLSVTGTPYPSSKIMWVVGPNVTQLVTLSGKDLRGGAPLWFEAYPSNTGGGVDSFTTRLVLDPAAPNRGSTDNSTGHWNIWGIGMIATTASCYEIDVTSPAGSWHTVVATGTVNP